MTRTATDLDEESHAPDDEVDILKSLNVNYLALEDLGFAKEDIKRAFDQVANAHHLSDLLDWVHAPCHV